MNIEALFARYIIETLKGVDKNDEKDVLFAKIKDFKISDADKKIQLDKYLFLREKGFLKILTKQISSMERYQPKS